MGGEGGEGAGQARQPAIIHQKLHALLLSGSLAILNSRSCFSGWGPESPKIVPKGAGIGPPRAT